MKELYAKLQTVLDDSQIRQNEPLSRHTTFRTGGPADWFLMPKEEQIAPLFKLLSQEEIPVAVIGNGSNLLAGDGGYRGAVIEIGRQMDAITVDGDRVTVQAGALLSKAASLACQASLTGMEFAAGIPGSLGGAVVMNAGAYGGEMKDIVRTVRLLTPEGEITERTAGQMQFGYRTSCVAAEGAVVLSAVLQLRQGEVSEIRATMDALKEKRVTKQPLEYPSAGSTFKRPEGYFAGKLIEDAGLRGYRVGDAQVSEKHCGFVVNRGHATAADVMAVIRHVQRTVKEQYQVELETEVKMLGEF